MGNYPEPDLPDRILIVRLGAIGDVVNALVLASALKRARPGIRIGWAVHELALPLVSGHPHVDRVHLWRRGERAAGLRGLLADTRATGYDLAIDLQRIAKSALLARRSGAQRVLGFDRARCKELSWMMLGERIPAADPGAHMVEQYLEFARYLGIDDSPPGFHLPRNPESDAAAERMLTEIGGPPILINIGASKPENRWPEDRFAELARGCAAELGQPVALIGGPGDRELFAGAVAGIEGVPGVFDLVGRTSLTQLIALQACSRLMVSCDTGPMHMAAAGGLPVVALFGPADPGRTGPYGEAHRVLRAPGGTMGEIEIQTVLEAVRGVLSASLNKQPTSP